MEAVVVAPEILGLLAALLLLVFVYANYPTIFRAWQSLWSAVPFVGPWIAQNLTSLVLGLLGDMQGWLNAGLAPATALLWNLRANLRNLTVGVSQAVSWSYVALFQLQLVRLPAVAAQAVAYTDSRLAAASARLLSALAAERVSMLANFQTAVGYSQQLFALAEAQSQALYGAALVYTDRALAAAVTAFSAALAVVRSEALAGIQEAEALGRLASTQDRAYTDAQTATAVGHADAVGQAGRVYTDQKVGTAEAQLGAEIGSAASSMAAALAVAATAIQAIEDSPCMQACDVLGGLGVALEGIDALLIISLIASGMRDPQGTAEELGAVVVPVLRSAEGLADGLLRAVPA